MTNKRRILIVGGGTAGWLTAAYLAKFLGLSERSHIEVTVLESPNIGIIGVGEGTFPTIRTTLQFLGIDEKRFIRETSATFKQGIRFVDWARTPVGDQHHHYVHPFEAPFYTEGTSLVPYWLLQDPATRPAFAQAVTIQDRVVEARRAPKRSSDAAYTAPLNYAYHFDAIKFAKLLAERARELGVQHVEATLSNVALDASGAIDHVDTLQHGSFKADLYIDCTGFRAELIGQAMESPFKSVRDQLFTDRALTCKLPLDHARDQTDAHMESCTIATAHEAGWTWDIGLNGARGIGCVYSSQHISDDRAAEILRAYIGPGHEDLVPRRIAFAAGYREQQWVKNCVAVGLSAGFLEPLESTGLVLIEAAAGMIAEMLPHSGPMQAPARRFNQLMTARFESIVNFLKLHYALSQRQESFWRDNANPASIPDQLAEYLEQWKLRPPGRFDFELDTETFAFFNYQYILYGMEFKTDLSAGRDDFPQVDEANKLFAKIQRFGDRALGDLPSHRALIQQINAQA